MNVRPMLPMKPRILIALVLSAFVVLDLRSAERPASRGGGAKGPRPEADTSNVSPARRPDQVVAFKKTPQTELKAHFYLPPGWSAQDRRPAIVFWSGGGFRNGAVGQFLSKAEYFASRGMVAICAEYRDTARHGIDLETCVEDARSAMRWVKAHAADYGIDSAKVVASGGSAGGTLSLLVAREKGPNARDDDLTVSPRPAALVLFNPAVGEKVLEVLGRGGPGRVAVNAQIVALDTPERNEPPAILFYGTEDRPFLDTATEFTRKALVQGTRCELWTAEKMPHGFFNRQPWHSATTRKADEFLASLGYVKGPPTIKENSAAELRRVKP